MRPASNCFEKHGHNTLNTRHFAIVYFANVCLGIACSLVCCLHARGESPVVVGDLVVKLIDQVEVPALETGALRSVDVRLGDRVVAGQTLAVIDDRTADSRRLVSATDLEISKRKSASFRGDELAKKALDEKRSALQQQRVLATIAREKSKNETRVSAAEKAEAAAKNEWARAKTARETFVDSVSESELESLRLNYERSRLERVQAAFELRMDRLSSEVQQAGLVSASLAADRAEIEHAVAATEGEIIQLDIASKEQTLAMRELELSRHQILTPIAGMVVEVYHRAGEWVRPGDPVVRVINTEQLHAEGFLTGKTLPRRGTDVKLVRGEQTVLGTVDFVSPERDPVNGEVRFLVLFKGGAFLPGERVSIQW